MTHARAAYAARYGRLPGKSFGRNYEHIIDRIRHSIAIQYDEYPWWTADRWDPVHDHRVPVREHETRGWSTIRPSPASSPTSAPRPCSSSRPANSNTRRAPAGR